MKTNLLKISSLIMMVMATAFVYAYNEEEYAAVQCPPGLYWNPEVGYCDFPDNVKNKANVILINNRTGKVIVVCYERENRQCKVTKLGHSLIVSNSENATSDK